MGQEFMQNVPASTLLLQLFNKKIKSEFRRPLLAKNVFDVSRLLTPQNPENYLNLLLNFHRSGQNVF